MCAGSERWSAPPTRAERYALELEQHVERIRLAAALLPRRPRVYFEEWDEPLITGIRWVSELIGIAGGDDVFPERAACALGKDRISERSRRGRAPRAGYHFRLLVRQALPPGASGLPSRLGGGSRGARRRAARDQVAVDPAARAGGPDRRLGGAARGVRSVGRAARCGRERRVNSGAVGGGSMRPFKALRIHEIDKKIVARFDTVSLEDLSQGDVVVRVRYSSINYKDALAATGSGRILKRFPLVGGIDLAGSVVTSLDVRYTARGRSAGHRVRAFRDTRWRLRGVRPGQWRVGDSAARGADARRYDARWHGRVHRRTGDSSYGAERPDAPIRAEIVVTGASGGVGSLAIDMLSGRGYQVVAVSGKPQAESYLKNLGATRVLPRQDIKFGARPLEPAEWAGAIDNVGGEVLSWLTRTVNFWGNIASVGLAGGPNLTTTVMPFILRGVSLLGHQLGRQYARAAPRSLASHLDRSQAASSRSDRAAHAQALGAPASVCRIHGRLESSAVHSSRLIELRIGLKPRFGLKPRISLT